MNSENIMVGFATFFPPIFAHNYEYIRKSGIIEKTESPMPKKMKLVAIDLSGTCAHTAY